MKNENSTGIIVIAGGILAIGIVQAIQRLVEALVQVIYGASILGAVACVGYLIYRFLILPETDRYKHNKRVRELTENHEILSLMEQCFAVERTLMLNPELLHSERQMIKLKLELLVTDIKSKSIPYKELEFRLKQIELFFKRRSDSEYTPFEDFES